ncbi:ParB/RepB/Spo0J family partition protein [Agilicoccus flavus]|uniref:ParB/RepB/Spo0J family partition protein n=1 Tax=Agilicoccus flavus TaxID=2775968 RepID=UPI001CF63ECC|nr:ParB/RepB/Spo0J family partition protein [Agilicoccus flavus]
MAEKRRGLGRGLGALIPTEPGRAGLTAHPTDIFFRERPPLGGPDADRTAPAAPVPDLDGSTSTDDGSVAERVQTGLADVPGATFADLPLDAVMPNARQPRTVFDEDELAELVHSIREIGVLQPIVVRPLGEDGAGSAAGLADGTEGARYEIVMGERRWRASRAAGQATIPAIVRRTGDDDMLRDALLENLHRSQLNPLEEAAAYQQLLEDFGCTHEELASRIGRSRPQITNIIRLLRLPPLVARRVAAGVLSAGHARALLGLPDAAAMERLAQRIVAEGLSVRSVEEIVALGGDESAPTRRRRSGPTRVPELDDLAARLADRLDTRVSIAMGRSKGKMTVEFASVDDLNRILATIADEGASSTAS